MTKLEIQEAIDSLEIRCLNKEEVELAEHLLWDLFANVVKWTPPADTPTEWRVVEKNGRKLLKDKFSDKPTTVFHGAFDYEGKLQAFYRIIEGERLDFEQYHIGILD